MAEAIYLLLAAWMIVSGLDDLWVDLCFVAQNIVPARKGSSRVNRSNHGSDPSSHAVPPPGDPSQLAQSRIALWIPAWREDAVIARMIAHNVSSIRYANYHIFAGTYPNDEATLDVLRELEDKYSNLHVSLTPHDGPTSKADNLNWIYQNMGMVEDRLGTPFDIVVIHDSEDLIHPEEFRWLNHYCRDFDFVQIPVLALPTPWWQFTHGVYCDEFAETQQKDLPTRNRLNGFSPSCGVGTGYRRTALSTLAESEANRLFEPDSLTEDYLNGLRMHRLGLKQIYLPVGWINGQPVATREYFPQRFTAAVRQRTRWVTGIALQTWQKIGWSKDWRENYWLWRDRKGLIGNPLSLFANLLLVLTLSGVFPLPAGHLAWIVYFGVVLQLIRTFSRMYFSMKVYGVPYGLLVPLRIPWSNLVNTLATLNALWRYARARLRRETLVWLKTEHQYPNRQALTTYTRRLGEVLVDQGQLTQPQVDEALAAKPVNLRLGEHLVATGLLTWAQVYNGLAVLSGYPTDAIPSSAADPNAARCLPLYLCEESALLPLAFVQQNLLVATSEVPSDTTTRQIRRYIRRDPVYTLVTPVNLAELRQAVYAAA